MNAPSSAGQIFGDPQPIIVGHRGARRAAPENTMPAFRAAWQRGATWVEFDVRLSADAVPVVIHDPQTEDGAIVSERTADELATRGIPTLAEILRELPDGMGADVEIKHREGEPGWDADAGIARACAPVIADFLGQRPLLVTSFDPLVLNVVKAERPEVPTGLVTGVLTSVSSGLAQARELNCAVLAPHFTAPGLSEDGIRAVSEAGLEAMVWTVNGSWHARRLAGAGIHAICTDDVVGTVGALDREAPGREAP